MSLLKQKRKNWYKHGGNNKLHFLFHFFPLSAFNLQDEGEETKIADTAPPKKNPAPIKASFSIVLLWHVQLCIRLNQLVWLINE